MIHGHKRLVQILFLSALLVFVLLIVQIKKNTALTVKHETDPLVSPVAVNIPIDQTEAVLGNPGAEVTLVAFLDFGSNKDRKIYKTVARLVRQHPQKLRFVLKPAPSESLIFASTHNTIEEALACASLQKKQWEYADALANVGTLWRLAQLSSAAESAQLDMTVFKGCQTYGTAKIPLAAAYKVAQTLAPNAPALYANNRRLNLEAGADLEELLTTLGAP